MAHQHTGYICANTLLFSHKVSRTIEDMTGIGLRIRENTISEKPFTQKSRMLSYVHFSGMVQGDYIVSLDETVAAKLIGVYREGMSEEELLGLRDEYGGFVNEALNIAVGQAVVELEKSFGSLTFVPPTLAFGTIVFPEIISGTIDLDGEPGQIQCAFSLNMANLKIGQKLEEALRDLEVKAQEALEARNNIETMLALYPAGLVTINERGEILPGHSKATVSVVGLGPGERVVGRTIDTILGMHDEQVPEFYSWLEMAFDRYGQLPFKDIVDLCCVRDFVNKNSRILTTGWLPVVASNGALEKLLVVIEDITAQRKLEREMKELAKRHQDNLEVLSAVIDLQPDEVTHFVFDTSRMLSDAQTVVKSDNRDREFINSLFRTFHTIKSSSGQYHFKGLQSLAHEIEGYLRMYRDDNETLDDSAMARIRDSIDQVKGYLSRIDDMRNKLGHKEETVRDKVERSFSSVLVNLDTVSEFVGQIHGMARRAQSVDPVLSRELGDLGRLALDLRKMSLSFFVASLNSLAHGTAKKLGKKADVRLGADLSLDVEIIRLLHQCLMHIVNNAVDHGIETPTQRRAQGKRESGLIIIGGRVLENGDSEISVSDDGKGVDIGAIKARLIENRELDAAAISRMQPRDFYEWLFRPGFTTRDEANEISGRGVGLEFVAYHISKWGGRVAIESEAGKGARISMIIPAATLVAAIDKGPNT